MSIPGLGGLIARHPGAGKVLVFRQPSWRDGRDSHWVRPKANSCMPTSPVRIAGHWSSMTGRSPASQSLVPRATGSSSCRRRQSCPPRLSGRRVQLPLQVQVRFPAPAQAEMFGQSLIDQHLRAVGQQVSTLRRRRPASVPTIAGVGIAVVCTLSLVVIMCGFLFSDQAISVSAGLIGFAALEQLALFVALRAWPRQSGCELAFGAMRPSF